MTKSIRIVATLPVGIYEKLAERAALEQRPVGHLANYILEAWIREQEVLDAKIGMAEHILYPPPSPPTPASP